MNAELTFLLGGEPVRLAESCTLGALEVRLERSCYGCHNAEAVVAFLTNRGDRDTALVEDIRFEAVFPGKAQLYHGNGDTKIDNGYEWWVDDLPQTLAPCGDGTSCNGAFPYMRLLQENGGVNLAFGWTGTWVAEFTQMSAGVKLSMGQKRCHMVIRPGETVRVPSLTVQRYTGDEDAARNAWRRFYFACIMPKKMEPLCCMHLFGAGGKPEFTGATEENQLAAIESYLEKGIRPDVWWIDAGWYPCDYQWPKTGNWYPNPENFPRGLKPIGDKCHAEDMAFLLWFEPERIQQGTKFALEHPDWVLHSQLDGKDNPNLLVNLGDPACCDYVIDLLDGYVKAFGVDIYRQDFNLRTDRGAAGQCWLEAETEDRIGAVENQHIQGYYRLWDTLLERNPGLLIDSCASGGRRNDIETMRRSVTLHYTDVGYGNHPIKLKQHRQMFEWIPYFRAHNMNWCAPDGSYDKKNRLPDKFSYYAAMAPAMTDMTEFDADDEAYDLARRMQTIWRAAAQRMLYTDYYPLTECRKSSDDFYGAQFLDPVEQSGILHLLNGATATETRFTVKLKGLEEGASYCIRSAEQGTWTATGKELMAGVPVELEKRTGDVWFFDKL